MKKVLLFIRDLFELYLPVASFIIMFLTFITQVFFRYVIRHPLTWSMEITAISFVYTVIFGACYTMRRRSHVKFTMIYDRLKPKAAAAFRMLGNIIIVGTFLSLIYASYKYALFIGFQKTPIFRIKLTWVFLPFTYFLFSVAGYTVTEIIEDIRVISGALSDSADHKPAEAAK